jgi:hypothetical protein
MYKNSSRTRAIITKRAIYQLDAGQEGQPIEEAYPRAAIPPSLKCNGLHLSMAGLDLIGESGLTFGATVGGVRLGLGENGLRLLRRARTDRILLTLRDTGFEGD